MNQEKPNEFITRNNSQKGKEFSFKAIVPKEKFNRDTEGLLFWSSENLIPLETTVKGYLLLVIFAPN